MFNWSAHIYFSVTDDGINISDLNKYLSIVTNSINYPNGVIVGKMASLKNKNEYKLTIAEKLFKPDVFLYLFNEAKIFSSVMLALRASIVLNDSQLSIVINSEDGKYPALCANLYVLKTLNEFGTSLDIDIY